MLKWITYLALGFTSRKIQATRGNFGGVQSKDTVKSSSLYLHVIEFHPQQKI